MRIVSLLLALCLPFSLAWGAESSESSPRLLIHLLDYIALDYPGAVGPNGKILEKAEFDEQIEFAGQVTALGKLVPETKASPEIQKGLGELQHLVTTKAEPDQVRSKARDLGSKITKLSGIQVAPTSWPVLHRGKKLYGQNCAACHGPAGKGDGPAGLSLDPKPANFLDGTKMAQISPFSMFNTIRLGVPGTAMAAFPDLSDLDIWDLSFYVASLRYASEPGAKLPSIALADVATKSDAALMRLLTGDEAQKVKGLAALRTQSGKQQDSSGFVTIARESLSAALVEYKAGHPDKAVNKALVAYLDGVEPIEPRLKARDNKLFSLVESRMGAIRSSMEHSAQIAVVDLKIREAMGTLDEVEKVLTQEVASPAVTFSLAAGIFLREAFEAILFLITLLGITRSLGSRKARGYIHAGWILAIGVGVISWFFSGWAMEMSGANRELLEGTISLFAVLVLLYMGFWLHRKTEIGRWRAFIGGMVQDAVDEKRLIALAGISFMAVFREAFETVLFLRALELESGGSQTGAMLAGVGVSFIFVLILATALLRFSAKIPIRQLFDASSWVMIFLSFILVGKAIHSFQETNWCSITEFPWDLRLDLVGIYPTYETLLPQILILLVGAGFWFFGKLPKHGAFPAE
jgi:high-affinity iron transporter